MLNLRSGFKTKLRLPNRRNVLTGSALARRHPRGKLNNCATSEVIVTLGYRMLKNWLIPDPSCAPVSQIFLTFDNHRASINHSENNA
jgi:hypothetical protein